jgi:hypothetical protein
VSLDPSVTPEVVLEQLSQYVKMGILDYVLPTEPLGEAWVLGVRDNDDQPSMMKFKSTEDVVVFMQGMALVAIRLTKILSERGFQL